MIEEPLEQLHAQARIQPARRGANRVHRQLRQSRVEGAHPRGGRQRRADGAARAGVVADLEHLQLGAASVGDALQDGGAQAVGGGVGVWVGLDGDADVQTRGMVFEMGVEVVGVHGVADVGGDEETVGVGLRDGVGAGGVGEGLADALDCAG